jgi:hypothetical protein
MNLTDRCWPSPISTAQTVCLRRPVFQFNGAWQDWVHTRDGVDSVVLASLTDRVGVHRTTEDVEVTTAAWVHWFHHHRLYEHSGDIPPVELARAYDAQQRRPTAG